MDYTILDLEADGLESTVTKVHCVSWYRSNGTRGTITNMAEFPNWVTQQNVLVGHNVKIYDIPVVKKVLGVNLYNKIIDTLPISWYLYPQLKIHGLEAWGEKFGFPKPVIKENEWLGPLPEETYAQFIAKMQNRCESDVEINKRLFEKQIKHLISIYGVQDITPIMEYLTYKLDCAREQLDVTLKVDRQHCQNMLNIISPLVQEKYLALQELMPRDIKYNPKTRPIKMYNKADKKTGIEPISKAGHAWLELLFDKNLPLNYEGEVLVEKSNEPGNPNSGAQLKKWLFSLGWKPTILKYVKDIKTKATRAIPQISDKDGYLCLNIQSMFDTYPFLENLDSFSMLKHRENIFIAFLECSDEQGNMKAEIAGLTNTLRFKHKKPIANLPGVGKPYGKEIRGAIVTPNEESLFCGSDMSSLEDSTKQHYMYYYDPEYVMEMRVPGFDPHIDICLLAKLITTEDVEFFKWYSKNKDEDFDYQFTDDENGRYKVIVRHRKTGKVINFSGIYGAGPPKISLTSGLTLEEATILHTIYWERNKAVKQIAKDITIKVIFKSGLIQTYLGKQLLSFNREANAAFMATVKEMWLYNPVSTFWYSLRYFKDIFSTLNQGTGVYCFDTWIKYVRQAGIKIALQYHDEIGFPFLKTETEKIKIILTQAIARVNEELKLNVPLGISIDIGTNYADCH